MSDDQKDIDDQLLEPSYEDSADDVNETINLNQTILYVDVMEEMKKSYMGKYTNQIKISVKLYILVILLVR